jgi:hypothetical protein
MKEREQELIDEINKTVEWIKEIKSELTIAENKLRDDEGELRDIMGERLLR